MSLRRRRTVGKEHEKARTQREDARGGDDAAEGADAASEGGKETEAESNERDCWGGRKREKERER